MGLTLGTVMIYLYPEERGSKFLRNYRAIPPDCFEDYLSTLKMESVSSSESSTHFRQIAHVSHRSACPHLHRQQARLVALLFYFPVYIPGMVSSSQNFAIDGDIWETLHASRLQHKHCTDTPTHVTYVECCHLLEILMKSRPINTLLPLIG